ncbi:MAG: helix-turn-helix domain-containing protein [Microcoleus sp. CSU_2_2]|nr:helix-turn-helix domain-containing protein [Microcoleus sp. SU_5_3]NJS11827.1 helix-turn-helix domain-containing protein [Microcoleus sp. CSU_2_2]
MCQQTSRSTAYDKEFIFLFFKTTKKKLLSQETERAEKLAEIGAQLRQFREQQSICLEKVALVTMIRRNLLQAIEEGQLDQLPEPVYTQGLIKRYAEAMGLDGAQFANFFPIEPAPRSATKLSWQDWPQLRPMHLYLFYVFLIICSVNGLSQLMSGNLTAKNSLGAEELANQELKRSRLVTAKTHKVDSYTALEAVRAGESLDQSGGKPVMVNVTFNADSWVQIEVDGKTEFEGTLPSGTVRTWQAQEKLVFVAGNAGGVLIAVNNGQAELLGAPGVAKEVIFKADEIKTSEKPKKEG